MIPINSSRIALRCHGDPPLSLQLEGFAESLSKLGYASNTVRQHQYRLARFERWLVRQNIASTESIAQAAERYLQETDLSARSRVRGSLSHLLRYLRSAGAIDSEQAGDDGRTAVDRHVTDFRLSLRQRNLATGTVSLYAHHVSDFLHHAFADGEVDLLQLGSGEVRAFVKHATGRLSNRYTLSSVFTALRSFLRHAQAHVDGMPDLSGAVPAVACPRLTFLPRGISADQTAKVLSGIDRGTPAGCRDHAVLLLLSQLGLRLIEVARLTLDDIDWLQGTLTVTAKGGLRHAYPMSEQVGEAIADYLQHGRAQSVDRRLFLRVRAPIRGFDRPSGLISSLRRRIEHSGAEAPTGGAHQFRHGLATQMLQNGASLAEISDVLGHRHPDTTRIYAKVDIASLRALALPWPGGDA